MMWKGAPLHCRIAENDALPEGRSPADACTSGANKN